MSAYNGRQRSSSRCPGIRSRGSSAASASTPRSISRTARGRVPLHVVDLSRLQRLHEGQGPARRPLHHQPDLRHLRRQPRHLRDLRAEHGLRRASRRPWPSGSSTSAKPPSTCSTTTSSRTTWSASTSASRWCARPTPACWRSPSAPPAQGAALHGFRTIADIMRALNPFDGLVLPRGAADEPRHARDVLPDGRPARASLHALSGRRRHRADACSSSPTTWCG